MIITIDPGASGGVAWIETDGYSRAAKMPDGMSTQADFLRKLSMIEGTGNTKAILEKVGTYVPGNSGPAAATFARHCGHLEAILYCLGLPVHQVTPGVWMKSLGVLPKDKQERKRAIKEMMARLHPHLAVTLSTADALGMLYWYQYRRG